MQPELGLIMPCEDNKPYAHEIPPLYRYQALPPGPYLRILHLQPGQAGDAIECSLQVALLEHAAGRYDALSYEWGPPTEVYAVEVNGSLLQIRSNLYWFLGIIRHPEEVIKLWVDAICIDQSSVDEKNHQVQQMWSVYFNASTTRVFLNTDMNCPEFWDWRWGELVTRRILIAKQALMKVLDASYWTRLWVIQEIIASNAITVQISPSESVSWATFFGQCKMVVEGLSETGLEWWTEEDHQKLAKSGIDDLNGHTRAVGYESVHHGKRTHGWGKPYVRDWDELITSYGQKHCIDIRDRVYGLNGSVSRPVQVDYGLHTLELFMNVMKAEDDQPTRYAEQFAEKLWRALGLDTARKIDVQLSSGLLIQLKIQRVLISRTAEMIFHGVGGRPGNLTEHEGFFTLSAQEPGFSSTPSTPLFVVPWMPRFSTGKDHRTLRHVSPCTGIALTPQQVQLVPTSSLNGLGASLVGAQVRWNFGMLVPKEATIVLSVLAYHHARTVFELQPR